MGIKMKLIDNDYVVCADTDLELKDDEHDFRNFLKEVKEDLIVGKTAFLEIDDMKLEVLKAE